jgi:hypothetical protein
VPEWRASSVFCSETRGRSTDVEGPHRELRADSPVMRGNDADRLAKLDEPAGGGRVAAALRRHPYGASRHMLTEPQARMSRTVLTVAIIDGVKIDFYFDEQPPPHVHARYAQSSRKLDIAT